MIPQELIDRNQWICWDTVPGENGKPTKVPIRPWGRERVAASSTDRKTWGTYEQAVTHAQQLPEGGVGYVFSAKDPYVGIDLDDAFATARVQQTQDILDSLGSYTEVSPSGKGLHVIVRGALPYTGRRDATLKLEAYAALRFFTMTGKTYGSVQKPIAHRQSQLDRFVATYLPARTATDVETLQVERIGRQLPDDDVLDRIHRSGSGPLLALLEGRWQDHYASESEADFGLANYLAYWTGGDYEQTLRLAARTPLWDAKWERPDYQLRTAGRAVSEAVQRRTVSPVYIPPVFDRIAPERDTEALSLLDSLSVRVNDLLPTPPEPLNLVDSLLPDPEWVRYGVLVGTGGTGKSTFALQLAVGLASGTPIAGHWTPTEPCQVVYLSGEDNKYPLWNRINRVIDTSQLTPEQIELAHQNLRILDLTAHLHQHQLMEFDGQNYIPNKEAFSRLIAWILEQVPGVKLVMIDTLARFAPQAEENNPQAAAFVSAMEAFAARLDAMVLVLHHTSKARKTMRDQHSARGASVLVDNSRHSINITPALDKQGDEIVGRVELTVAKASYMAREQYPVILTRGLGGILFRVARVTREEEHEEEARTDEQHKANILKYLWGPGKEDKYYSQKTLLNSHIIRREAGGLTATQMVALVKDLETWGFLERDPQKGWTRRSDEWSA